MLNIQASLHVVALLSLFMTMKCDFCLLFLLRRGVYVGHTDIEEGILSSPPEIPSLDIQAGSWVSYCRFVGECLTSYRRQMWFLFHVRAHTF